MPLCIDAPCCGCCGDDSPSNYPEAESYAEGWEYCEECEMHFNDEYGCPECGE